MREREKDGRRLGGGGGRLDWGSLLYYRVTHNLLDNFMDFSTWLFNISWSDK